MAIRLSGVPTQSPSESRSRLHFASSPQQNSPSQAASSNKLHRIDTYRIVSPEKQFKDQGDPKKDASLARNAIHVADSPNAPENDNSRSTEKQLRKLAVDYDNLSAKYNEMKKTLNGCLWEFIPSECKSFSALPAMSPDILETDDRIGPYSMSATLGYGQFSLVRECHSSALSRGMHHSSMAIKVIDKSRIRSVDNLIKIKNEVTSMRELAGNADIVQVLDMIHGRNNFYIVMEHMEQDLFDFLEHHPNGLNENLARCIICPVVRALAHCHTLKIAHRDLKPENILIKHTSDISQMNLVVKLADFGLSQKISDENGVMSDFCGSPGFFAPEVLTERRYNGFQADSWGIGCIALEIFCSTSFFLKTWMSAYRQELWQKHDEFTVAVSEAVSKAHMYARTKLSAASVQFITSSLQLSPSNRLSCQSLLALPLCGNSHTVSPLSPLSPAGLSKLSLQTKSPNSHSNWLSIREPSSISGIELESSSTEMPSIERRGDQRTGDTDGVPSASSFSDVRIQYRANDDDEVMSPTVGTMSRKFMFPSSSPSPKKVSPMIDEDVMNALQPLDDKDLSPLLHQEKRGSVMGMLEHIVGITSPLKPPMQSQTPELPSSSSTLSSLFGFRK